MIVQTTTKAAFTLVETLVAVSVLLLVVVGPLTITTRTTKSATFASEQVIAHFLAQEGLELAQKGRDEFLLAHYQAPTTVANPWTRFTQSGWSWDTCSVSINPGGCGLSLAATGQVANPIDCDAATNNCAIRRSTQPATDRVLYRHGTTNSVATPYTRVVQFFDVGTGAGARDPQIRVVSTVTWRSGNLLATQQVQLETYLFNVYDRD